MIKADDSKQMQFIENIPSQSKLKIAKDCIYLPFGHCTARQLGGLITAMIAHYRTIRAEQPRIGQDRKWSQRSENLVKSGTSGHSVTKLSTENM